MTEFTENRIKYPYLALVIAVFTGLLFNYLFIEHNPGISYAIFIAVYIKAVVLMAPKARSARRGAYIFFTLALVLAIMVAIYDNMFLGFMNMCASLYLLVLGTESLVGKKIVHFKIRNYIITPILLGLNLLRHGFGKLGGLLTPKNIFGEHQTARQVLKGAIMAVPVLFIFILLFSSADLVFKSYITSLFNFNINDVILFRIIVTVGVSIIMLGALVYTAEFLPKEKVDSEPKPKTGINMVQLGVFLGLINGLFLLFIGIQFAYLFGGQANITQLGFTYAEYAHRGFAEIIIAGALTLVILLSAEYQAQRNPETSKHTRAFKVLSLMLIAEVIVILLSAYKRLDIYDAAYGATTLRLYVTLFIVWMQAVFIWFAYKIMAAKQTYVFVFGTFVLALTFLFSVNALNPDAYITRKNLLRYQEGKKLDVTYISSLSADAVPQLAEFAQNAQTPEQKLVARFLYSRRGPVPETWQSFNLSRKKALDIMQKNRNYWEQYKDTEWPDQVPVVQEL